jgi:hypothetical protein
MYTSLVRLVALLMIVLGLVMIGVTLYHGFGVGLLLGALFIAAGVGRLVMISRRAQ